MNDKQLHAQILNMQTDEQDLDELEEDLDDDFMLS